MTNPDPAALSTAAILTRLREIRTLRTRRPDEVLRLGEQLVLRGTINRSDDEAWTVKEQVATAAIESGNFSLAEVLVDRIAARFPTSSRVAVLKGMLLEGQGELEKAKELYEKRLLENQTDVLIRKRLISLHLSAPLSSASSSTSSAAEDADLRREKGIDLLVEYLDASYVDAEGWMTLGKAYAELGLYPQSLSALSHPLLLHPQNPFLLLQHAETAYTAGDIPLAYKEFLRVVEMSTDEGEQGLKGAARRAAMGAKLCIPRLRDPSTLPTLISDPLLAPQHLDKIELLLTKLLLGAYEVEGAAAAGAMRMWVAVGGEAGAAK
ncbi:hypothetical protein JCM1840_004553 [Sporobolomyces johnsonii]